ncbi:hypothetical protein E2C01_016390 [Portunus trituberculatus]|uniref:Uncharacterized protein n=1 Tax=Portunus trituberculatus TaxID=210409 RepID=A0A5B7DQY2_PORTR|nr:hypothetical protein [Portunus trituberculatus]
MNSSANVPHLKIPPQPVREPSSDRQKAADLDHIVTNLRMDCTGAWRTRLTHPLPCCTTPMGSVSLVAAQSASHSALLARVATAVAAALETQGM